MVIWQVLTLFQTTNVQEAVEREYAVFFRPSEQVQDERSPFIFHIPRQNRDFTERAGRAGTAGSGNHLFKLDGSLLSGQAEQAAGQW